MSHLTNLGFGTVLAIAGCTDPIVQFLDAGSDAGTDSGRTDAANDSGTDANLTCDDGLANCDGNVANGCEVELETDESHCGGCGVPCDDGAECTGGRCRIAEWVDTWDCESANVLIRSLTVDDDGHLFAVGTVPEECTPLGQTALGGDDWAVARYESSTGARDSSWIGRYGGPEDDIAIAASTSRARTLIGGTCRAGFDFGAGPETVVGPTGCIIPFSNAGVPESARIVSGNAGENVYSVVAINGGGSIVAGTSRSIDITPGTGCDPLSGTGDDAEIFVVRYAASGACQWARRYVSGTPDDATGDELVAHSAVDDAGNTYLVGTDVGTTTFDNTRVSQAGDAFVLSLNPAGDIRWVYSLATSGSDRGTALAVGGDGVFVGIQIGASITITGTPYTPADASDVLLLRLDAATGNPTWVTPITGNSTERLQDVAYDEVREQLVTTGEFGSGAPGATISAGELSATADGLDVVSLIVDARDGTPLDLLTFGGAIADRGVTVAVDRGGAVFLGGRFRGPTVFPNGVAIDGPTGAGDSGFVFRWEPDSP